MSTKDNSSETPGDQRKKQVEDLTARWLIESGQGVPYISLDLSSPRADQLRLKQAEYQERIRKMSESGSIRYFADAKTKLAFLDLLLQQGNLDLIRDLVQLDLPKTKDEVWEEDRFEWSLTQAITERDASKKEQDIEFEDYLNEMVGISANAFFVLQDYVNTGGQEIDRGTGTGLQS